jgi:3-dehydroquinate synthase
MISYKVNNIEHKVTFCKSGELGLISKSLEKINSDKNVLLIYDDKIERKVLKNIFYELKLSGCKVYSLKTKGNKTNKNEKFLFNIINFLIKNKFSKKSVLISCGGGVIGDVAALASSLYLRGTIYFSIPSTMTAIVDSSIGGKTGINYKGIINSLGTYYHPKNVFILEEIISSIPQREYIAGIAEIIKCGLIDNKKILTFLSKNKDKIINRNYNFVAKICEMTLRSKIKFFSDDIFENKSRLILNFGHTFAHAIEMGIENEIKKDFIRHGEAVALGILCEIYYSNRKKNNLFYYVKELFDNFGLPTSLKIKKLKLDKIKLIEKIYMNIFLDKKKINQYPRYISLKKQGKPNINEIKDFDFINDTILQVLFN